MTDDKFLIRCNTCGKTFATQEAKERHKLDKHQPHRQFKASERPRQRGAVPCRYPGCEATFQNEWNARQHRRDAHNEAIPPGSTLSSPDSKGAA